MAALVKLMNCCNTDALIKARDDVTEKIHAKFKPMESHPILRVRIVSVCGIAITSFFCIAQLFLGIFLGLGSLLPFKSREKYSNDSGCLLGEFGCYFRVVQTLVLNVLNPQKVDEIKVDEIPNFSKSFLTEKLYLMLHKKNDYKPDDIEDKKNWKIRALMRANYLVCIPLVIVTRIVDFALGLVVAALSLVTLGCAKELNVFAINNLGVLQLVNDLFGLVRSCFYLDKNFIAEKIQEEKI